MMGLDLISIKIQSVWFNSPFLLPSFDMALASFPSPMVSCSSGPGFLQESPGLFEVKE